MKDTFTGLNPAAIQRQIQALTAELLTVTISRASARRKPKIATIVMRASAHEPTKPALRDLTRTAPPFRAKAPRKPNGW